MIKYKRWTGFHCILSFFFFLINVLMATYKWKKINFKINHQWNYKTVELLLNRSSRVVIVCLESKCSFLLISCPSPPIITPIPVIINSRRPHTRISLLTTSHIRMNDSNYIISLASAMVNGRWKYKLYMRANDKRSYLDENSTGTESND